MASRRTTRELLRWRSILTSSSTGGTSAARISKPNLITLGEADDVSRSNMARNMSAWMIAAGITAYSFSSTAFAGSYLSTTAVVEAPEEAPPAAVEKLPVAPLKVPRVVFVLGGPGSGKGTQCAKIVDDFGFTHLSAGDLLRAEINSGSENGNMIKTMIREGKIVPAEVTVALLQRAMAESGNDKFLIDGFPRNDSNREVFERDTGINPEFVLFFDCPEEVMEKRLLNRNQGRIDDNIETIRKRFKTFIESSIPVVDYYDKQGKVRKVNGTKSPDEVFKTITPFFLRFLQSDVVEVTQSLLNAIDTGDYATYAKLCDPGLTAFEPEAQGHLVEGLDFHKYYFDLSPASKEGSKVQSRSTIVSPKVLISGDLAVVTYTRLKQDPSSKLEGDVDAANETRVWERRKVSPGVWEWKHIHFHRSKAPTA